MNHKQTIEKPKILLVDDLPANLDILVELLRDFQADLVTASSGKMALELTREHEFALILLDVQMPDLDGFETAKIILSRIDTPIIFLTAYGSEKQNIIEGYTIGAVDYLVKPFDASILKKKVSVFLLLYQQKSLLKQSNHRLNKEITERREIEQKLISAKSNLEHRVKERTKELNTAYKNLKESEDNIQSVINNIPAMIAFIDNNYCYVYSNLQYQEFLGQTESLKGKHMETVLGRKVFNKIKNRIDVALGGELVNYETDYSDKGSDIKYVNVTHVPHMKGKISLGFFSLILDITDQKEEEVKQKIQENQSRQLRHLKSLMTLSGGVAHEFNNLLVPIVGFTKMVQKNLDPECADAGYLGRVLKTAYRAKDIVAQVQLFSKRKELGSENVQPEVILDQLLKKNIKSLPAAIELKIEFGCDILPIIANPHQLEHIIINLYENAIEAMLDGGILKIKLDNTENDHLTHMNLYKKDQACICLSFEDTGHGMNSETCAQIFNPFFTTRGKANHTGLGLSVVLNIVEQFGGYIDVSSKLGEGANFKIYLPASKLAITQG